MSKEYQLPNSFTAEQGVLGGILYMPGRMSFIADSLTPDDFYYDSHRHRDIFAAMRSLYGANVQIDVVTVLDRLERMGITEIKNSRALVYLQELFDLAMYTGDDLTEHAKIVRNTARKREQYAFLGKAAEIIAKEPDAEKSLEQVQTLLSEMAVGQNESDLEPLASIMIELLESLDTGTREQGKITGLATGLDELDAKLAGLQKQQLYVLGGLAGQGKTSLALNIVYDLAVRQQKYAAVFSLEMSKLDLAGRLLSMDTGIDSQLIRAKLLEDDQWDKVIYSATEALASQHVFIDESGDVTITTMRTKVQRFRAQHGLDLIVVDYLQLMQFEEEDGKYINEVRELSKISRGLKKMAKYFNVPVLAVASLSRAATGHVRPQLSDLRGSGSIEYDSDVVMFIGHDPEQDGRTWVNIAKHRNGPVGEINLRFDASITRFYDDSLLEVAR